MDENLEDRWWKFPLKVIFGLFSVQICCYFLGVDFLTTDQLADVNTLQGTKMSHLKGTPPKTNHGYLDTQKRDDFNRKYIFQPLIFRGHVSFPGSSCEDDFPSRLATHQATKCLFVVGLLQISLAYSWPSAGQMEPQKILTRGTEPASSWGYLAWKLQKFGNTITSNIQKKRNPTYKNGSVQFQHPIFSIKIYPPGN